MARGGTFSGLMDLYRLAGEANRPPPDMIEQRLSEIEAEAAASGEATARATVDRLARLIRQRLAGAAEGARRAAGAATPALRLLVSGVAHAGTTPVYRHLGRLLQTGGTATNFRYRPHLWTLRTAELAGDRPGMAQLNAHGIHVHQTTPLILRGAAAMHDRFVDDLFGAPFDGDPARSPEAYVATEIRAGGRLRGYLDRFPDLKIVACLRNPLETVNDVLGSCSFFGEEFHADDRDRFREGIAGRSDLTLGMIDGRNTIEWQAAWWRVFTEEALAVARDYPGRVLPVCREAFETAGPAILAELERFSGIAGPASLPEAAGPGGPRARTTSLTTQDIARLRGHLDFYHDEVLCPLLGAEQAARRISGLAPSGREGVFGFPVAGSDLGRKTPAELRAMILAPAASRTEFQTLVQGPRHKLKLPALVARHDQAGPAGRLRVPVADPAAIRQGRTFGAVITCFDNESTIVDAVLSCLNQTLPFDEIVVVDDNSSDGSLSRLRALERLYGNIRVIALDHNQGPSAARDLGIRQLGTDFLTQLDGDDLFWPGKNAAEAAAIAGDETAVAFSDILLVTKDRENRQSTAAYAAEGRTEVFPRLLARTRQIPRDLTMSRRRYFEAGGYDLMSSLYEDWDLKLRLAALGGSWRRADGVAGTIYNRMDPGLSSAGASRHARAISLAFLRAVALVPQPAESLLPAFDAALGHFGNEGVSQGARSLVDAVAGSLPEQVRVCAVVSDPSVPAMDDAALADLLRTEAARILATNGAV